MTTPYPVAVAACLTASALLAPGVYGQGPWIDSAMDRAPYLPPAKIIHYFPEKAKPLWRKALKAPQADVRAKAAAAFSQAKRGGMKGLDEVVPDLIEALGREDQHPVVRLAVARALIDLEAKKAAASLWEQASAGGADLRELVEPALARWGHAPATAAWLKRLADPETPQRQLVLAVRGLATAGEANADVGLRGLVTSGRTAPAMRLEAARALGQLRAEGLEGDAAALAGDATPRGLTGRLLAAALLGRHASKEAVGLLQGLAKDREPAIAAPAARRLIEIDPKHASGVRDHLLASRDPALRGYGTEVLLRVATDDSLRLLAERLDDLHPDVRARARRALLERARKAGERQAVIKQATAALKANQWRAQEQAAILLADLDHRAAGARLAELLWVARPEVFVTAAWALRRLGDAESLPAALEYLAAAQKRHSTGEAMPGRTAAAKGMADHQLSQLAQHLGQSRYAPADAALRRFVPPGGGPGNESRAAAIWALGLIHEGRLVPGLAKQLEARLNDIVPPSLESDRVRQMSAVTLGRMKAKDAVPSLRKHSPNHQIGVGEVGSSCAWAVERITGEKAGVAPPQVMSIGEWFLLPVD
jgi:HEAT repeat protein